MPSNYSYVTWQLDDEVTSTKLQQMSDNDQWIHDNMITGNITYLANGTITPDGRTVGTEQAEKVHGFYIQFNSEVPVTSLVVEIPYAAANFTFGPIITFSIASGPGTEMCGVITTDVSPVKSRIKIFRRDGASAVLVGRINVICLGR